MNAETIAVLSAQADALEAQAKTLRALVAALRSSEEAPSASARRLVSRAELLEHLSISSPTLRKLESSGALPFVQVGDLRRYDLESVRGALSNAAHSTPSNVVRLTRKPRAAAGGDGA